MTIEESARPTAREPNKGIEDFKEVLAGIQAAFPDLDVEIEDIVAELVLRGRPVSVPAGETTPWGVCLSGGGIRSAAFCLGALQEMQRFDAAHPLIQGSEARMCTSNDPGYDPEHPGFVPGRANYITSVSGGSYIASALMFVAQGKVGDEPESTALKTSAKTSDAVKAVTVPANPAFHAGSPEERYLRDHTRYLSHGFGGPVAAIWQLLVSIVVNLVLLSLIVGLVSVPVGWIYGHNIRALQAGSQEIYHFAFSDVGWPFVPLIAGGLALLLAVVWVVNFFHDPVVNKWLLASSLALLGATLAWLCFAVGVPIVLEWLHRSVGSKPPGVTSVQPSSSTKTLGAVASAGTAASVLIALFGTRVARTIRAGWQEVPQGVRRQLLQQGKNLFLRLRVPLINLLIFLVGPFTLLCLVLLGVHIGSLYPTWTTAGRNWDPFLWWLLGVGVIAFFYVLANVTSWSLHPFYRERLSDAFCLKRFTLEQGDIGTLREDKRSRNAAWLPTEAQGEFADHRPYMPIYKISAVQPETMPVLIVCAAANVSTYGATPTGFRSTSFVFSNDTVGGGLLGDNVTAKQYEDVITEFKALENTVTLPAAVAMSGAAVSPEMGRTTRAPLRFLLTLANVRLGVWIPNPTRLDWFSKRKDSSRFRKWWIRPRLEHLLFEMIGKNKLTHKYLYVTDGGHYENLGLLEQLRKGSRYIFCLDASGEQQDGFSTIAGAVALASSEEQIRIEIQPETMAPDPDITDQRSKRHLPPVVQSPFCVGNIYYPEDQEEPSGRLVIIKAGVPANAPENIADFHQSNWRFPCDPTLDQLYSAERFDAYKALGAFATSEALRSVRDDFEYFRRMGRLQAPNQAPKKGPVGPP